MSELEKIKNDYRAYNREELLMVIAERGKIIQDLMNRQFAVPSVPVLPTTQDWLEWQAAKNVYKTEITC